VQPDQHWPRDQRDEPHPQQLMAVLMEEVRCRHTLGHIDDAADEAEQRYLDDRHTEAHHNGCRKHGPYLA